MEFLTHEEAERFLTAAKEYCPERYPLFLTALRAGLRLGELLALEWGDIQFGDTAMTRTATSWCGTISFAERIRARKAKNRVVWTSVKISGAS